MKFFRESLSILCLLGLASSNPLDLPGVDGIKDVRSTLFEIELRTHLSPKATISHNTSIAPRWSDYHAPTPGTVVNVATESDVQKTVRFLIKRNVPFLAQNGAHGWINQFNLSKNGVLINLRGLNKTTFSADKTQATIGGGAIIKEVITQAAANDVQVLTGNCNCVGTLGAALGGGYGNLMGLYGFSVDNILSLNVVLANGNAVTVTPSSNPDLWWALRGAGPNFGIVTSAVMRSKPLPQSQNTAWTGGLFYTEDKIEQVVQAVQDINLQAPMNVFLYFATSGAPNFTPVVFVTPFYFGSEADGRAAFKSFLDIGPVQDTTAVIPQSQWNTGADGFCIKGGRKPSYGAGLGQMDPATFRSIWNLYTDFLKNPGAGSSSILVECYSLKTAQAIPATSSAFGNRDVKFNAVAIPWYSDAALDSKAEAFGSKVRDLWRSTDALASNRTYPNFAFGDESTEVLFGESAPRLKTLKKKYDPYNVFSHFLPIKP